MRFASMLAALTATFFFANLLPAADTPPDVRLVTAASAQVWCGPNTANGLYPTNVLRHGDRVQVEREMESGWLVIHPPAGSFSWINNRFVKSISPNYANYVITDDGHDVPVLIGSSMKMDRPSKIGVKLPRGAQVRIVGRPMTDEEGTWLPIEPPEGEVRYLRKEAVAKQGGAAQTTSSAKSPVHAPDADTLWRDAQRADNAGRLDDAVRLYRMAGDANLSLNPGRAEEAYRRAHWIEQAKGSTYSPVGSHYYPDGPAQQPIATVSPFVLPINRVGTNAVQPIGGAVAGTTNGQLVSAKTPAAPAQAFHQAKGRLQHAFKNEVNRRYHLLDDRGHPVLSVRAAPGVDLSSFEGKKVELCGQLSYVSDLRNYLLTATSVREVQ